MRMLLLLGFAGLLAAAPPGAVESFEYVWQTIQDKHYAPAELERLPGGGSWLQVRERFRPRIEAAQSNTEVRALLREMLALLGKSHYAISGMEFGSAGKGREGGPAAPGFAVDLVEGKIVVTRVQAESEAAKAGVSLGWELLSVEGNLAGPAVHPGMKPIERFRRLRDHISGYHGETLEYVFATPGGEKRCRIPLPKPDGSQGFGYLQGMTVEREARRTGKNLDIAYFRLAMFLDAVRVLPEFEKFIAESRDTRGFVLDLRGNPGGIAIMANSLSGWFVSQSGVKLGTMYQRDLTLNFAIIPRLNGYAQPLAILIDGASASTSEILAGGLQQLGRAKVFGSRSAGAALPSLIERLPNGDYFQYAVANYISQDGKELEGNGVEPDVVVEHTLTALQAGRDRMLDAALDWIYAQAVDTGRAAR